LAHCSPAARPSVRSHAMSVIWCIGLISLAIILANVAWIIYLRKIRPATDWKAFQGEWAIITGASEGIGKAYAEALAKRRINVVLMSRSAEPLQKLAVDIKERFGVEARPYAFDFSTQDDEKYNQLFQQFSNLKVTILINNVGGSGMPYDTKLLSFADYGVEDVWRSAVINVKPTVYLTKAFLPIMRNAGHGAIINVSSIAGARCFPLGPCYGGAKAFIDNFTLSVAREFKDYGITLQSCIPGNVFTKLNPTPVGPDCCSAETLVENSLNLHGTRIVFAPWANHGVIRFLLAHLPESLALAMGGFAGDQIKEKHIKYYKLDK